MLHKSSSVLLLAAALGALPANADLLYTKNSPVLRVDESNYDRLISRSNHASVVEFYAPWCGHCQQLKPAYEKAAKSLDGLANVAAVNCDDDSNKSLCGRMGIKGFPTLKIVVPSKKPGKPRVEDYQGPRMAKDIVEAVVERIPNHVNRVADKDLDKWLSEANNTAKAILFTEKGTTSALLRALAIDFLGSIQIAQIRNKEAAAMKMFGITKLPTLVLLPGDKKDSVVYDGALKKKNMVEFLSQVAKPNQAPSAEPKSKKSSKTETPKASSTSDAGESSTAQSTPSTPPLRMLLSSIDVKTTCLSPTSGTCVLVISPLPADLEVQPPPGAISAVNLAEIAHKHNLRKAKLFPFYITFDTVHEVATLKKVLGLGPDPVQIVAINGKRGWFRRYDPGEPKSYGTVELEKWIDAIRLGEGKKEKIPEGALPSDDPVEKEEPKKEPEQSPEEQPEEKPVEKSEEAPQEEPEKRSEEQPVEQPEDQPEEEPGEESEEDTEEESEGEYEELPEGFEFPEFEPEEAEEPEPVPESAPEPESTQEPSKEEPKAPVHEEL